MEMVTYHILFMLYVLFLSIDLLGFINTMLTPNLVVIGDVVDQILEEIVEIGGVADI